MPFSEDNLRQTIQSVSSENLESVINVLLFNINSKEHETVAAISINNLLTNSNTRVLGLKLISVIIPHCSSDAIKDYAINWASHCTLQYSLDNTREIKLNILASLLQKTAEIEHFNKKFTAEYLPETLKMCLSGQTNPEKIAALKCLTQCMKRFPNWFGHHKSKVEPFLVNYLDQPVEQFNTSCAAIAFHYFQQTGNAGVEGINYVTNFKTQFRKICSTIHKLFDEFFENISEFDSNGKIGGEAFIFNPYPPSYDYNSVCKTVATRIMNCTIFLKMMIVKEFPVQKQIYPKHVLDLINRGLSVHICPNEDPSTQLQAVLLKKIQLELLKLLHPFIKAYRGSILPFSYIISKIFLNALKRSESCSCFVTDSSYKLSTYKTLKFWLSSTKNAYQPHLMATLVPILLKDISPVKRKIVLNLKSNKATQSFDDCAINPKICICALDIIKCLLEGCLLLLEQGQFREIVMAIVGKMCDLQSSRVEPPYFNIDCQLKLYEVLVAFYSQENIEGALPPIHLATNLLNCGVNHWNYKVAQVCSRGLDILEKISQPVCSSLYFGKSDENEVEQKRVFSPINDDLSEHSMDLNILPTLQENQNIEIEENNDENCEIVEPAAVHNSDDKIEEEASKKEENILEKIEEPPEKKRRNSGSSLEDMFDSFQDIVQ